MTVDVINCLHESRPSETLMSYNRHGDVMKQEAAMLGSKMTFLRRTDEAAAWLVESVAARDQEQTGAER